MDNIIKFINYQKETYKIGLNFEIILGKSCNDFSFEELNLDEKTLNDIVKNFRNYKLSYSQGKIYKYGDLVIKTFNNKNTEIIKTKNIDNTKINFKNFQIIVLNNLIEKCNNISNYKDFNEEIIYDEICIHIDDNILLYFQNKNGKYIVKYNLVIEKNISLLEENKIFKSLEQSLILLQNFII